MTRVRDTFCSFCGTPYADATRYPRACGNAACAVQVWANPIPVSVVLVPVRTDRARVGLLVVRRAIEPQKGRLGLVGGFLEEHETWQVGGAREVVEETGVRVDPSSIEPFWFASTEPRPNRVLLFSVAAPIDAAGFPPFAVTSETSERGLVFGPVGLAEVFAFPLHVRAAERFFTARGLAGPHDYTQL
jgi:ADP-ribose pyrophosphatase YjhB (NUDIX family)